MRSARKEIRHAETDFKHSVDKYVLDAREEERERKISEAIDKYNIFPGIAFTLLSGSNDYIQEMLHTIAGEKPKTAYTRNVEYEYFFTFWPNIFCRPATFIEQTNDKKGKQDLDIYVDANRHLYSSDALPQLKKPKHKF